MALGEFPGTFSKLPRFFERQPGVDAEALKGCYLDSTMAITMQSFTGNGFPILAQAIGILDRIVSHLRSYASTTEKVRNLKDVDAELRDFLAAAMKGYRRPGHHCGAIAVSIRQVACNPQTLSPVRPFDGH